MKETTVWILTYLLLVAAFAYMIGWVSGELLAARMQRNNWRAPQSTSTNLLRNAGAPASVQRTARRSERRPQAYRRCLKSPQNPHPLNHTKSMAGSHRSGRSIRCGL